MSGTTRQKVNLDEVIKTLIDEVESIDANSEVSRSEKTKLMQRAAKKVNTRLHDGRKNDDDNLAISTYRKYMTTVRRAVTAKNWKHHSLQAQIDRLCKKYPEYSDRLQQLGTIEDITELRIAVRDLYRSIKNNKEAYAHIKNMRLDHEVMRHLTLPELLTDALDEDAGDKLTAKSNDTVDINYHELMAHTLDLLTHKTKTRGGSSTFAYGRLALGLALATGRRAIEILRQGQFKKLGSQRLEFSGQAKKRGGADYSDSFTIYTLIDADIVMNAFTELRQLPEIVALHEYDNRDEVARNDAISKRTAKTLNTITKQLFNDDGRVFKDSRAIWARIAYEQFFATDPAWKKKNEDVFWQQMLGHDDSETQKSYKQFKVDYSKPESAVSTVPAAGAMTRLEALTTLDNHADIVRRKALDKVHQWVKEQVTKDAAVKITQSMITREVGSSRPVISDYLKLAADALAIIDTTPSVGTITEVKATAPTVEPQPKEPAPEKKSARRTSPTKPKLEIKELESGGLCVKVLIDDEVMAESTGADRGSAIKAAWRKYEDLDAVAKAQKIGEYWNVEIAAHGRTLAEVSQKGARKAAIDAAWHQYQNR